VKLCLRLLRATLLAFAVVSFAGCSFHSTQYEFVKSLVSKKEDSGPKKNWIIEWNGLRTPVYAVNGPGYVLFVDEFGVQLKYQDAQITDVKGLLPKKQGQEIAVTVTPFDDGVTLGYRFFGESVQEVHSCSLWRQPTENSSKEANRSMWIQNCSYLNFKYRNRRWLNEMGQLVRLEYLLKRGYPHANIALL
jgi:hypothetical protein